jgi:hypothetical protein
MAPSSDIFLIVNVESGVVLFCFAIEQAIHFGTSALETFVQG